MEKLRGMMVILLFVFVVPSVAIAESTFSIPAGASGSSNSFSTPAGADSNLSYGGFSPPAGSAGNMAVRGQITDIQGDTYIVRDEYGREVRVQPSKDARVDYTPRLGDNVEAQLDNGSAISILRTPGQGEGSGASAPESSSPEK